MAKPSEAKQPTGDDESKTTAHALSQADVQIKCQITKTVHSKPKTQAGSINGATTPLTNDGCPDSLSNGDSSHNDLGRDEIVIEDRAKNSVRQVGNHDVVGGTEKHSKLLFRSGPAGELDVVPEKSNQETDGKNFQHDEDPDKILSENNPLFPSLPLYGPPSLKSRFRCMLFRLSAFVLSLSFLVFIVIASLITSVPRVTKKLFYKLTLRDIKRQRPFYEEECRRADIRRQKRKAWEHRTSAEKIGGDQEGTADEYPPTEGGRDKIVCDVGYYARRVGLDVDMFQVRTDDGFLIDLWHVYDPREYTTSRVNAASNTSGPRKTFKSNEKKPKFPVLLMHGLLQSSGAYCSNDDDSLAFWLCKSGFDVWLGNNRCGFSPAHESFVQTDPRMWCWNIREMGVFDLPALTSRVLEETGFDKIGLICHSQGTAETLIALSKDQRPEFGEKLTVFCGLAPAAYAGPLIGKFYFKFMRNISPFLFQMMFGIHAFIPFMMQMHSILHPKVYGWLGYKVFSFLFDWSDARWDRGLRNRLFQFAPVYVSAETMRWWLGQDGFAKHKCILSTKEVVKWEEREDGHAVETTIEASFERSTMTTNQGEPGNIPQNGYLPTSGPWYNERVPPFALWVCGNDQLVDGERLLKRFTKGREPHVKMVHSKVIKDYEHLDVIWAIDAVEQVFTEIREVLWQTCNARDRYRVPEGCEAVATWSPELDSLTNGS